MRESLAAACGQFEQVILADMLRTAGVGKSAASNADDDGSGDGERLSTTSSDDAFQQLVVQALSGALERAGGIGLQGALRSALTADQRP